MIGKIEGSANVNLPLEYCVESSIVIDVLHVLEQELVKDNQQDEAGVKSVKIDKNYHWIDLISHTTGELHGPTTKFEFLAKRLLEGSGWQTIDGKTSEKRIVLGSPIYVALAE